VTVTKCGCRGGGCRTESDYVGSLVWLTMKLRVAYSAGHVLTSCFTEFLKYHYDVTIRNTV